MYTLHTHTYIHNALALSQNKRAKFDAKCKQAFWSTPTTVRITYLLAVNITHSLGPLKSVNKMCTN